MKSLKVKFAFLIFIILIQSCNKYDDCATILCVGSSPFIFELVNTNGENLLSNGTIQASDIKVIDVDTQNTVEFHITNESNIDIYAIDLQIGTKNHIVQVSEIDIFGLLTTTERNISKCCDVTDFIDLNILNSEYTFNEETLVYTFLIE